MFLCASGSVSASAVRFSNSSLRRVMATEMLRHSSQSPPSFSFADEDDADEIDIDSVDDDDDDDRIRSLSSDFRLRW